jgi:hypothetical protein
LGGVVIWGSVADGEDHAKVQADCAQAGGDGARPNSGAGDGSGFGVGRGKRKAMSGGGRREWKPKRVTTVAPIASAATVNVVPVVVDSRKDKDCRRRSPCHRGRLPRQGRPPWTRRHLHYHNSSNDS